MKNIYCPLLFLESDDGNGLQVKRGISAVNEMDSHDLETLELMGALKAQKALQNFSRWTSKNYTSLIVLSPTKYIAIFFFS